MRLADRWPVDGHTDLRDELLLAWDRPGYHDLLHLTEVLDRLDQLAAEGPTSTVRPSTSLRGSTTPSMRAPTTTRSSPPSGPNARCQ